jgi:LysM repeat protein
LNTEVDEIIERWTKIDTLPTALKRIEVSAEPKPTPVGWGLIWSGGAALAGVVLLASGLWLYERNKEPTKDLLPSSAITPAKPPSPAVEPTGAIAPAQVSLPSPLPRPEPAEPSATSPLASTPRQSTQPLSQPDPPSAAEQSPSPTPTNTAPPVAEALSVTVLPGQTLVTIAHANHVPVHTLEVANHLQPPYELRIGDRLLIPDR